jgi:hypothetical protein
MTIIIHQDAFITDFLQRRNKWSNIILNEKILRPAQGGKCKAIRQLLLCHCNNRL